MLKLLLKIVLLGLVLNLVGCSAQILYTSTIESQRNDAELVSRSINLDFGNISYLENNTKDSVTIVLLHGFGGDKDIWNEFSASLDRSAHIIALDLPGHGKSVSSTNLDYSISHQAVMLEAFLKAKNIEKIHIVGNSMGGAVALKYAAGYPHRVKSLTLIDALGMIKTKSEYAITFEKTGINSFFDICTRAAYKNYLHMSMEKEPYIPDMVMDILVADKCARAEIEKVVFKDMLADSELSAVALDLKVPTLIIWGAKDRVLHIDNAHLFHKTINGSQLVVFRELGHVPMLEDAEASAGVFDRFVSHIH